MSKRHAEDDNEGQNKRRKTEALPIDIVESMEKYMTEANETLSESGIRKIPSVVCEIPRKLLDLKEASGSKVFADLERFKEHCNALFQLGSARKEKLGVNKGDAWYLIDAAQLNLQNITQLADQLKDSLFTKSVPSTWAGRSVWSVEQRYPGAILCLRPPERSGPPLTLLHSVFCRFRQLRLQPLPRSQIGIDALWVASQLCGSMGKDFEKKEIRGSEFDEIMGNLLPGYKAASQIVGRKNAGIADRVVELDGHCIVIREDKLELGDGYMQVSRSFDLACEEMKLNRILPDAPVFLLCVMGPSLTIAGGFKDHADTVVEPLCPMILMLKDMDKVEGRVMDLAMHLFALRTCMEETRGFPNPLSLASGLPRVFQSYQDDQGQTRNLTFQSRLSDPLVFAAVDDTSRQLCVKIIYGPYGEQVHRVLASEKMAPELFGVSRIEHGPTMVVMEMLDTSWMSLRSFCQKSPRWVVNGVQSTIRGRLERIVDRLENDGLVHGDFRANNIMVKQNEEGSAKVIDFDWAGKAGEVYYPLDRNHDPDIKWPDKAGSAIRSDHDRKMLDTQWKSLTSP